MEGFGSPYLTRRFLSLFEEPLGMIKGGTACEHNEVSTPISNVTVGGDPMWGLDTTACVKT